MKRLPSSTGTASDDVAASGDDVVTRASAWPEERDRGIDDVLASIGDLISQRDAAVPPEQEQTKALASALQEAAHNRFGQVATDFGQVVGSDPRRRAFVDMAPPPHDRRQWHRAQVIEATRAFDDYFAGFNDYSAWVRLGIVTETGQGQVVVSFHSIGRHYRGVIGAVMVFFRRSDTEDGSRQVIDVTVLGTDPFQVNYKEREQDVVTRFRSWLEPGLVEGLDLWPRTE